MRCTRYALILAGGYAILATIYILVSGMVAAHMSVDVGQLERIEKTKGVVFVLVTALAVFAGARIACGRIERADALLRHRDGVLLANERRVFAGLMAASTAHDANNALQGVIMDLGSLERTIGDDAKLRSLHVAVERLVALNRRLMSTVRQGRATHAEDLDLGAVVNEAVTVTAAHEHLRAAHVRFEAAGPIAAHTYSLLVHQIVGNLVLNAGEAVSANGHVEVRLSARGGIATLEVHDDGPGVAPGRRAHLFEALETTKNEGSGLGLFSVKACAEALGGSVEVGDSPLGGACFTVRLPLAVEE